MKQLALVIIGQSYKIVQLGKIILHIVNRICHHVGKTFQKSTTLLNYGQLARCQALVWVLGLALSAAACRNTLEARQDVLTLTGQRCRKIGINYLVGEIINHLLNLTLGRLLHF